MYKISLGTIAGTILLIALLITMIVTIAVPAIIELIIDAVNMDLSFATDIILFSMLFIVLFSALLFGTYYCIRSIKYLYLVFSSDFRVIKTTENGLIFTTDKKDIFVPYEDIKRITIQEIMLFRGFYINNIIVEADNLYLQGFISDGWKFEIALPLSVKIKMHWLECNYSSL